MKNTSKTIIFFGNERLATGVTTSCPTLRALIENGFNIAAIVSNYSVGSPSRSMRELEIEQIAIEHNIPIFFPNKLSDISEKLIKLKADIGILVAYGKIIPQSIIDIFPAGIINIHPSNLPLHRGPTPIESVILDGSKETAVSVMKLSKDMDNGPVYVKQIVKLNGLETKQDLSDKIGEIGKELVINNLLDILSCKLTPHKQDEALATYDQLIKKDDGIINNNKTAEQIERSIRAYAIWPKSRISIYDNDIIITKAHVSNSINSALDIECADSTILSIDELIAPSGRKMNAKDFLNGYKI